MTQLPSFALAAAVVATASLANAGTAFATPPRDADGTVSRSGAHDG